MWSNLLHRLSCRQGENTVESYFGSILPTLHAIQRKLESFTPTHTAIASVGITNRSAETVRWHFEFWWCAQQQQNESICCGRCCSSILQSPMTVYTIEEGGWRLVSCWSHSTWGKLLQTTSQWQSWYQWRLPAPCLVTSRPLRKIFVAAPSPCSHHLPAFPPILFSTYSFPVGSSYYRAMHVVLARYCYRKSSVRPSVCLSVTLIHQ